MKDLKFIMTDFERESTFSQRQRFLSLLVDITDGAKEQSPL